MSGNRVIGVDVGGTKVLAGIVDEDGKVQERVERPMTATSQDAVLDELTEIVRDLPLDGVSAVGFGVPARVDQKSGQVLGAVNIPIYELEKRLSDLPKRKEVVAYCRGPYCLMSYEAVELLRRKGLKARRLQAGLPEWRHAGLPIER